MEKGKVRARKGNEARITPDCWASSARLQLNRSEEGRPAPNTTTGPFTTIPQAYRDRKSVV